SQAARISRDFSELMISTILVGTPSILILASFVAVIIYTLRGGIEVFGRMAELVFPAILIISMSTWMIVYISGVVDMKHLTPILGSGIKTIWKESFPYQTSLPFGELVVFTMVWPALKDNVKLKKAAMAAVLTAGFLLSLNILGMISVLGPQLYGMLNYPLLSAIRMVSVADFLERIDAVVIMLMVAGGFFKVGIYIYGASVGTAQLLNLKNHHFVLIPLGAIIVPLGHIMVKTYAEHLAVGLKFDMTYLHLPLQFVIPSLLLIMAYFHQKVLSHSDPTLRQRQ
ncbi:GerAB/ArcD/ProY family transporter, partial [Paenibacillus sp. TAF58]